jgi:hypothetical protein
MPRGGSPSRQRDRSPASGMAFWRTPAAPPPTQREEATKLLELRGEPIDISTGLVDGGNQPDSAAPVHAQELDVQVERDRSTGNASGHGGSAFRAARISGSGARMLTAVAAAAARAVANLDSSFKGATAGSREPTPTVVRPPSSPLHA